MQRPARERFGWNVAAALVFALATASLFHGYASGDLRDLVPAAIHRELEASAGAPPGAPLLAADQRIVVAVAGRNARILLAHPSRLFEAESCYPVEKALALGEPEITLGVLGMPAALVLRDPIASFNFALLAITLIAAFAMYALTRDLTGVPAAGIVAGLLYAFHPMKVEDPGHAFGYDTGWTVLAFLFARRWFERGRWRDALALALCASLQVSSSLYPLLCAVVVAVPYAIWLVWRYGVRRLRPAQCAVVAGSVLAVAALVFTPYLELRGEGLIQARSFQTFMPWGWLAPGGRLFPGAVLAGLLCAGLAAARSPDDRAATRAGRCSPAARSRSCSRRAATRATACSPSRPASRRRRAPQSVRLARGACSRGSRSCATPTRSSSARTSPRACWRVSAPRRCCGGHPRVSLRSPPRC